jgi:hypothetical protein
MSGRRDSEAFWPDVQAMECAECAGGDLPEVIQPIKKRPGSYQTSASAPPSITTPKRKGPVLRKPASAVTGGQYIKLRYSSTRKAIGIRLRGSRQVMQVQMVGQPESTIEGWADECFRRLESGMTIENVKKWVQKQKDGVREGDELPDVTD